MGTCNGRSSSFPQSASRGDAGGVLDPWPVEVGGGRTARIVLVVDPYARGRSAICESLEAQGHTVLEAASRHEAIAVWQGRAGAIDVVLTEVLLPDADGGTLAGELTSRGPNLHVVYMHAVPGYEHLVRRAVRQPHVACLQKPIDLEELANAIRAPL